jgi:hypothetical protein
MRSERGLRHSATRSVLAGLVFTASLRGYAAAPTSDISSTEGDRPRMLIIMDTSRSMRYDPEGVEEYPAMDYFGPSTDGEVGPQCGTATEPGPVIDGITFNVTGAPRNGTITLACSTGRISSIQWAVYGKGPGAGLHANFPSHPCSTLIDQYSMHDDDDGCNGRSTAQFRSGDGLRRRGWMDVKGAFSGCVGQQSCARTVNTSTMGGNPCRGSSDGYALVKFSCSQNSCPPNKSSKFCIAKKALWNTVNDHDGHLDIAGGGYYQLLWSARHPAVDASFITTCSYDAYATAGSENPNNVLTTTVNDGPRAPSVYQCRPEVLASLDAAPNPGLDNVCKVASLNPTHECTKSVSRVGGITRYQNENAKAVLPPPPAGPALERPSDRPTDTPPQFFSDALSHWDFNEYLYIRLSRLAPATECNTTPPASFIDLDSAANALGDANTRHGPDQAAGLPTDCTAANLCAYFNDHASHTIAENQVTVYTALTPPATLPVQIGGIIYNTGPTHDTSTGSLLAGLFGGSCPATLPGYTNPASAPLGFPGCTTGNPCALTRGPGGLTHNYLCPWDWTQSAGTCTRTVTGYNPTMAIVGYTTDTNPPTTGTAAFARTGPDSYDTFHYVSKGVTGVCVPTVISNFADDVYPPASAEIVQQTSSLGCGSSNSDFPGTCRVEVVGPTFTDYDAGRTTCEVRRYRATFTASIPAVDEPLCSYVRDEYTYTNNTTFCRYHRFDFAFEQDQFRYSWTNNAGDYLGTFSVSPVYTPTATDPYCDAAHPPTAATFSAGGFTAAVPGNPRCSPELSPGLDRCPAGALGCRLRYNHVSRFEYFVAGPTGVPYGSRPGDEASFCRLRDFSAANAVSDYLNAGHWIDWCTTSGAEYQPETFGQPKLIADYYDHDALAPGSSFTAGYWGSPAPSVNNGDHFSPALRAYKDRGLSVGNIAPLDLGTLKTAQSAVAFVGFKDTKVSKQGLFMAYDPSTNPNGLRMPDLGNITPLTGALLNALEYIKQVRLTSGGECAKYSVLLVTDGLEFPSTGPAALLAAVRQMKAENVPVYVVGFGISSTTLDGMAVEAKTDLSGHAYNANDYGTLKASLDNIVASQLSGFFSRSKPTVTSDGKRAYVGYFALNPTADMPQEYKGHVDALSLVGNTTTRDWAFDLKLNSQTGTPPRRVMTLDSTSLSLTDFNSPTCGGATDALVRALARVPPGPCTLADATKAQRIVEFVRNDLSPQGEFLAGVPLGPVKAKTSRISDVYHSQPALDGPSFFSPAYTHPTAHADLGRQVSWSETINYEDMTTAYQAYASANASREKTVYVQSNTGTVHAIRDATLPTSQAWQGQERWAYVPRQILGNLDGSRQGHHWLADGSFGLTDVCFGVTNCTAASGAGWQSLLVGTLGRGGPHLFAMKVSDPANPEWQWDYSEGDILDTWAAPVIARVQVDSDPYKWGVFFGSGYSDSPSRRASEPAQFYVLDADPASRASPSGQARPLRDSASAAAKFEVPAENMIQGVPLPFPPPPNNVPARARVVRPDDGSRATRVYFGDTDGKVWRMNVTSEKIADWQPVRMFNPFRMDTSSGTGCRHATNVIRQLPDRAVPAPAGNPQAAKTLSPSLLWPDRLPSLFLRPTLGLDDTSQKTLLFVGSGDPNHPKVAGSAAAQNYFWAVEDTEADPDCVGHGRLRWAYFLDRDLGDKVLAEPVVIGENIIVPVYRAVSSGAPVCSDPGLTILYCFNKHNGDPAACLVDESGSPLDTGALTSPNHAAHYVVFGRGISSDLMLSGNYVVAPSDTDPQNFNSTRVLSSTLTFRVKSWRRVR